MPSKKSFFQKNGLSVVIGILFLIFLCGQSYTGWKEFNKEMDEKKGVALDFGDYLASAHFVEATFENWESEFLQMGMYVLLTIFLKQQGSSESKDLDKEEEVDREPVAHERAPWPVKKGGWWLVIYRNSLFLAFMLLFLISFSLHSIASFREFNKEQVLENQSPVSFGEFMSGSRLWFESFQNWQSEFIAVFSIVVLSIFLRQYGSPESKPVDSPDDQTGC
jgi:hypothetical protein